MKSAKVGFIMLAGFFLCSALVEATGIVSENSPYDYQEQMEHKIDSLNYRNQVLEQISDMQNKKLHQLQNNITFTLTNLTNHVSVESRTRSSFRSF